MVQILIRPEDVENDANKFRQKKGELEALVQQARNTMNNLQSSWQGDRANYAQNEWQAYQPKLNEAILILGQTSDILHRAAVAFAEVDKSR